MAAQECRGRETGSISSGLTPALREDWSRKRVLETPYHARIATSPQDTTGHVSGPAKPKVTWGTEFPADARLPKPQRLIGQASRPCDLKRVIDTPANIEYRILGLLFKEHNAAQSYETLPI